MGLLLICVVVNGSGRRGGLVWSARTTDLPAEERPGRNGVGDHLPHVSRTPSSEPKLMVETLDNGHTNTFCEVESPPEESTFHPHFVIGDSLLFYGRNSFYFVQYLPTTTTKRQSEKTEGVRDEEDPNF